MKSYLGYSEAKQNKININWQNEVIVPPSFIGTKVFENYDLNLLRPYIDWKPFFIAWEMHGNFPAILTDEIVGEEATKLYQDANQLLDKIIQEKWLTAKGTIGFYEAASIEDDIEVLHGNETILLSCLRQQIKKAPDQPNLSLADFIAPKNSGINDYIGAFAVTIHGIEKHIQAFEDNHDDYNKIMLQALADRFAEAFAEALHLETRTHFWGYNKDEKYMGIRPAPGYPACPDHTEKYKLFKLLNATDAIGVQLTESLAMFPASSVCGWYFANAKSQYFGIGKIQKDQLENYALRKKITLEEAEKWLRPVLE